MSESLNIIKLAVGIKAIDELIDRQTLNAHLLSQENHLYNRCFKTRNTPKMINEIIDSDTGSLYWVVAGKISLRQKIIGSFNLESQDQKKVCVIGLSDKIFLTQKIPKRPFQGWRYLKQNEAPDDICLYAKQDINNTVLEELDRLSLL
ncbi:MAG: DUF1489 family protein [Alphaproteobacteria bacterium]|jgi:hypothetical protein|tara:strand:- start:25189 stop:25632 length:444 start_codon:yes stop_codon:yes gene_type:complete